MTKFSMARKTQSPGIRLKLYQNEFKKSIFPFFKYFQNQYFKIDLSDYTIPSQYYEIKPELVEWARLKQS